MLRGAGFLAVLMMLVACGSQRERTATAPAPEPARPSERAGYRECQSVIAVGSSGESKLIDEDREALKALKKVRDAMEEADALCASDVDRFGGDGSTENASLADSADNAATLWVQAINARDWSGVCELSVMPQDGCESAVERIFAKDAGNVEIVGFYESEGQTSFALNAPDGVEPVVEHHDGGFRVHFEYAIIE